MRRSQDVAAHWRLNDETAYTGCDGCRKIKPPIFEAVYQASSYCPQYHYFCEGCSIQHMGEASFKNGLKAIAQKKAADKRKGRKSSPEAANS